VTRAARSPGVREHVTVAIATPLDGELVAEIRKVDQRLEVLYQPDLLPPTRYPNDHRGVADFVRTDEGERRWQAMIQQAQVLFGIPGDTFEGLREAVRSNPGLRFVQATAAGAGEQVRKAELTREELARVAIASASGVHAGPLAEFCIFGLLAFAKDLPRLLADQQSHSWSQYPVAELRDRTLLIVGLGKIGDEVARLAQALGMSVIAITRSGTSDSPHLEAVYDTGALTPLLPAADAVVITLPLTDETRGLIDANAISKMKPGATLVSVGRGGVIDETALVSALRTKKLAGAALDVYATEPLPDDSPLWELPNVLLSPHTAALAMRENERIIALFAENLRRYLHGRELISRVNPEQFY
jgi:phosphoglycerate dehydrogenase-like enzyme